MIVEVIAVGTELLLGQIINSNAAVIGARLADEGFDAHFQVTVGDNLGRLTAAIRTAVERADAVILTGGIGPTQDDLTREALSAVTGMPIVRDAEHAESIRERLTRIRGRVAESTLRMADHPQGAETLPNRNGVALGIAMQHDGVWLFATPGVPSEMTAMLDEQVLPRLRIASGEPAILRSRMLRTWGQGESQIAETLDDLYTSANPSVAFLVSGAEVRVRISAKARDAAAAEALIASVEDEVVRRLGAVVFGRDDDTVDALVVGGLAARGWRIATVEAATRGAVASTLASADRDRTVFGGGLTVPSIAVDARTDLSARALQLLEHGRSTLDSEVLVAVSEAHDDQVGPRSTQTLAVAVATPERTATRAVGLLGDSARVSEYAHDTTLHLVRLAVTGAWWAG